MYLTLIDDLVARQRWVIACFYVFMHIMSYAGSSIIKICFYDFIDSLD